jgi:chromosome segregation ATPase
MKNFCAFLVLCLIPYIGIKAQNPAEASPIEVTSDTLSIGNSSMPALIVTIPEAGYEKTLTNWKKTMEAGTKSNVVVENDKISIFGARLKAFENPVNVFSTIINKDNGLDLKTAIELSRDKYIDQSSAEYSKLKDFMYKFAKEQYIEVAEEQLKAEENKLKDLEKELASFGKDETKMEKTMRANKEVISTEKTRIAMLENQLKSVSGNIIESGNAPTGMGSADSQKEYVKDLEKQQKKIQNEIEASEKKISKAEKEIEESEIDKPSANSEEEALREKVTQQEAVVRQYQNKVNKIKEYK